MACTRLNITIHAGGAWQRANASWQLDGGPARGRSYAPGAAYTTPVCLLPGAHTFRALSDDGNAGWGDEGGNWTVARGCEVLGSGGGGGGGGAAAAVGF